MCPETHERSGTRLRQLQSPALHSCHFPVQLHCLLLLHRVGQRGDTLQLTGRVTAPPHSSASLLCSWWMGRQRLWGTLPHCQSDWELPGVERNGSTTFLNNCNEPSWLKIAFLILAQQSKACTECIAENNYFFPSTLSNLFFNSSFVWFYF